MTVAVIVITAVVIIFDFGGERVIFAIVIWQCYKFGFELDSFRRQGSLTREGWTYEFCTTSLKGVCCVCMLYNVHCGAIV